ncbi:alcohol dehydrogenase catalytic domain-containing protein [Aliagarivorans taiwanensis]|uniref:alcohol dehydrogenase catalytic domain-containing protein n=1 Tax=Aliagarivorans taiwanensis TaxID=561966 RepID=UPI00040A6E21|nr:alcohol dehydrogenase catalytic domain-containing protein [Aliagarivorans taiwanensis]
MLSIAVKANKKLELTHIAKPEPAADAVIVKVHYSGLCGSDLPRIFHNGAHFYPIVLGHEFSGEVVELGAEVEGLALGDRIACAPLVPCGECSECRAGRYSLCKDYSFVGSRVQGANAEYVQVPAKCCFKLDGSVSSLEGAFFEPLTVSLHAMLMNGGCEGKQVVVVGVGTIGLLAVQAAKALGAASVVAIDIDDAKLDKAATLGADQCINSRTEQSADSIANPEQSPQLLLETAGHPDTVKLCLAIAGPRATIALIGTLHQDLQMSHQEFGQILRKELNLSGSWMNYSAPYPGMEWQIAKELFANNQINTELLVDQVLAPDNYSQQVLALDGRNPAGKILLKWGEQA